MQRQTIAAAYAMTVRTGAAVHLLQHKSGVFAVFGHICWQEAQKVSQSGACAVQRLEKVLHFG